MDASQVHYLISSTLALSLLIVVVASMLAKRERSVSITASFMFLPLILVTSIQLFIGGRSGYLDGSFLSGSFLGEFNFLLDYISGPISITVLVVSMIIAIYAYPYMSRKLKEEGEEVLSGLKLFYLLYYIFAISMYASVISTNLVEFYLFLEVGLISSFILINNYGYGDRRKIALLYLVWTHIGAVLFLVGSLAFGYYEGSFNVFLSNGKIISLNGISYEVAKLIFALMLIGLLVKAAAFGFHLWLPYAHAEAPTPISALLSPLLIGIGPYVILRFLIPLFPEQFNSVRVILAIWGTITIIYGGLNALYERDFKRFLAYSSISQMGYLIVAAASGNIFGYAGLILHYIAHAFGKAVLFGSAGSIIYHENELRDIRNMGGMLRALPLTGNSALIGFFTITGMPPTVGFWSELFIVRGSVDAFSAAGNVGWLVLFLLFIGFSISISYSFYNYKRIFQGPPKFEKTKENHLIVGTLIALSIASVILFVIAPAYANALVGYLKSYYASVGGVYG